jgi:hypothetical protein
LGKLKEIQKINIINEKEIISNYINNFWIKNIEGMGEISKKKIDE